MRIVFRGTDEGDNLAPEVMAAMSAVNALYRSRHTLCLQLKTGVAVEKLLSGKAQGTQMAGTDYDLSDSGIDSLLRKVEFSRIDRDALELGVKQITKEKFLLDVAKASSKPDFEEEIADKGESLKKIMEAAEKVGLYSDIFILADGSNIKHTAMLYSITDMTILCVPQGGVDSILAPFDTDKTTYLVTEFDRRSMFDEQRMKKAYNTKKLAVFPYNPEFKDAYNTDDIFRFVATNSQLQQGDANYDIIQCIQAILMGKKNEEEEISFPILRRPNAIVPVRREKVTLDKSNVANKVGFFGLFKSKKKTTVEVLNDHVRGDEYVYDQEFIEVDAHTEDIQEETPDEAFVSESPSGEAPVPEPEAFTEGNSDILEEPEGILWQETTMDVPPVEETPVAETPPDMTVWQGNPPDVSPVKKKKRPIKVEV